MIDSCAFGSMTISGRRYGSDLIIYPDGRVIDGWWRKRGHWFALDDMVALVDAGPEVIVAGTGMSGMVKVASDLSEALSSLGVRLVAEPTPRAAELFNEMRTKHRTGGCFHLTC